MLKFINLTLVTSAVCFAIFAFMASLVAPSGSAIVEPDDFQVIEFVEARKDSDVTPKQQKLPPPPEMITKAPPTEIVPTETTPGGFEVTIPGIIETGASVETLSIGGAVDRDARPLVRVAPKYPSVALRDGKQGWVQLSFSITKSGSVSDVKVIAAQPKRIFNKEAIKALKKWKYKAKFIDGEPIKQENLTVQLDFNIDQAS
ncbi:energy transducer TonB [Thalassotalea crassostreae]|uniref:energy transducer TonB n=1 Tax=Thalassotalea crassostreae TaxID=1763536 RepID=UPI0008388AAF|nr:energy transducer TonB [Thalassotalea crassostreae]